MSRPRPSGTPTSCASSAAKLSAHGQEPKSPSASGRAERQTFLLSNREKRANVARLIANLELGTMVEVRGAKRSDEQNDALHGLIAQIVKQRPMHFGVRADLDTYKRIFMHAIGKETRFVPTLEGNGVFPLGYSTSKLTVRECSDLIEFILAWCAREGLEIKHFDDDGKGASGANNPARDAA